MKNKGLGLYLLLSLLFGSTAVSAASREVEALKIGQQEILQRLQALESNVQNQGLLEMLQMLERLQSEVRELRGIVEQQNHELEGLQKRQRELYLDIDRRLNDLQLQGVDAPANTAPVHTVPATVSGNTLSGDNADQERTEYKEAFETLADGRHQQAIQAFTGFLEKYPNSKYADNAQYWLGEANYASRKFEQAIAEFEKVLQQFPRSSKVPDAKLKMAYTFYELQRWDKARSMLTDILNKHPSTSVAPLAEKRLLRMTQEGH